MQKPHKAPGKHGIPAELLKQGESLMQTLHRLVCKIWNEDEVPCDWRNSIICPIYKKGGKLMCDNYRGISLLPTTYKIVTYIIRKRLEPIAEQVIREYQAGFRKGRSTLDHIFTTKQISEKCWEHNVDLFKIYIDFRQVYGHINREKLYEAMIHFHIPVKIIRLVRLTMTNTESQVRVQTELTDSIVTEQGLNQGDGLAPLLFNLALGFILGRLSIDLEGTIGYKSTQILAYADDITIISRSSSDATEIYNELATAAKVMGLEINTNKTQILIGQI
jgi:sorting nexin-29